MGLFQISHSNANFDQHRFPPVKLIKEIDSSFIVLDQLRLTTQSKTERNANTQTQISFEKLLLFHCFRAWSSQEIWAGWSQVVF